MLLPTELLARIDRKLPLLLLLYLLLDQTCLLSTELLLVSSIGGEGMLHMVDRHRLHSTLEVPHLQ